MIHVRISTRRAILYLGLIDHAEAADFTGSVAPAVARLRQRGGDIDFLILDMRRFAGWAPGGALAAQAALWRRSGVRRVAVLGSRAWAGVLPSLVPWFAGAEVRAFTPREAPLLRRWIREQTPLSGISRSALPPGSCA